MRFSAQPRTASLLEDTAHLNSVKVKFRKLLRALLPRAGISLKVLLFGCKGAQAYTPPMPITATLRMYLLVPILTLWLATPAAAIDKVAVEVGIDGYGHEMKLAHGALWWSVPHLSHTFSSLRIVTNAELLTGYWWNSERIFDTGVTPIFRIRPASDKALLTPYLEGGVGFHYVSGIVAAGRIISTNFQFGDHLAAGLLLGKSGNFDIAYKFQHLSNAGIRRPNAGINFHILRFVYRL